MLQSVRRKIPIIGRAFYVGAFVKSLVVGAKG
jgi:hypothetical protein